MTEPDGLNRGTLATTFLLLFASSSWSTVLSSVMGCALSQPSPLAVMVSRICFPLSRVITRPLVPVKVMVQCSS